MSPDACRQHMSRMELEDIQWTRFRSLLDQVWTHNPFWSEKFSRAGVESHEITQRGDLARLPLTTKQELVEDQARHAPYGSNLTCALEAYSRLHQTSGTTGVPMRWLDTPQSWNWIMDCWSQIFDLVGLQPDDRLFFPFSFGPFIGFWAAFEGANRLGNLCIAGGGMSSLARLRMIRDHRASVVCCTPTYALRLIEVAAAEDIELSQLGVRALIVAGEAGGSLQGVRQKLEAGWSARVFDHWGMTEMGSLAVECRENPGGMHVLEDACIVEILDLETQAPVAAGTAGELVVTNLGRTGSPLIRYRTGDLVCADTDDCPCGRSFVRLDGGVQSRIDDMMTIRGNNVFPSSIEAVLREFEQLAEFQIVLSTRRAMHHVTLRIEPTISGQTQGSKLVEAVARTVQDRLNFQADVELVPIGSLPRFDLKGRRFIRQPD
ncbi:MAG: AMP-binding protein [Planctomycetaceae bacterium]